MKPLGPPRPQQHPEKTRTIVTITATPEHDDDELLMLPEVKKLAGIGKSMIYRLESEDRFPKRFKPGGYASRWSRREVLAWRDAQRAAKPS